MLQEIILRDIERPPTVNLDKDIDWLIESFGFTTGRDTEEVTNRIVHTLLRDIAKRGFTTTEELEKSLHLANQRLNYHLRGLIGAGFIYRDKRKLYLREGSVKGAVEEMRRDANRIFDNLSKIAGEIDASLGMKSR